jgi:hypothetical protein
MPNRAALLIAHPGHELRVHHWLELARPSVFVITDGSGTSGEPRIESTLHVLAATGARPAAVMGRLSDEQVYAAMLSGDAEGVAGIVLDIARELAATGVEMVVADACEFYNPTHDLCWVIATAAVEEARNLTGRAIACYDYAVIGRTDAGEEAGEIVVTLDDAALRRKLDAAMGYPELRKDVEIALQLDRVEAFRIEALRPVAEGSPLPVPDERAFYERAGEELVAAGRFSTVLRYREHVLPFVANLGKALEARAVRA